MTDSISGKSTLNWTAIATELDPVDTISEPVLVKKRSRDFFWYSPILNQQLRRAFGDLVAVPKTRQELSHCLSVAYAHDAPVVLRGGGTGNYGQAVPLDGGLIIETTSMNRILEIGEGYVTAEAGAKMADINAALHEQGWEMAIFPSTQDIATIGGFVGGGSSGIGSVSEGMLRTPGNLISLKAMSVEEAPRELIFEGDDANHIHHAWGMNGVITQVTLRTVLRRNWVHCMATFDSYRSAYAAGYALTRSDTIARKLVSTQDARICAYYPRLKGHIRENKHLLVSLVPREDMDAFRTLISDQGGHVDLAMEEVALKQAGIPQVYEFAYNHTTLQVLKTDRSATYLQIGCPTPPDPVRVEALRPKLGDDVWMHHEYARNDGEIVTFDLPIVWYTDEERLREIEAVYETHGFPVFDAHTCVVEGGGMKNVDFRHLAWKKRMDPKGLLNSAKSGVWDSVKHLSADEIEVLRGIPL